MLTSSSNGRAWRRALSILVAFAVLSAVFVIAPRNAAAANTSGEVVVRARGASGSENMKLEINGVVVESWSGVGSSYADYSHNVVGELTVDRVRVIFDNNSSSRDLFVDYVELEGQRFESEASSTLSKGVWNGSCNQGYKQSEKIACNGWFDYEAAQGFVLNDDDGGAPPPPPPDATGEVLIRARGANGSENMKLEINGVVVESWTNVASSYGVFSHEVTGEVTVDRLRVLFDNNSSSRDLFVDYVELEGQRFESEASSTLSKGVWNGSCNQGYKQSEKIACNGWFDYEAAQGTVINGDGVEPPPPPPASGEITVRARGIAGSERMRLEVNDTVVATWNGVATSYADFTHEVTEAVTIDRLRVLFDNDAAGRDLQIDYVEVGDQRFQTEAASVRSLGIWTSGPGCAEGYKQRDTINCDGWVDYEDARGITIGEPTTVFPVRFEAAGADVAVIVEAGPTALGSLSVDVNYDVATISATACAPSLPVAECSAAAGELRFTAVDPGGLSGDIQIGVIQGVSGLNNVALATAGDAKVGLGAEPVDALNVLPKLRSMFFQQAVGFDGAVDVASDTQAAVLAGAAGADADTTVRGDANCDSIVNIVDALVIAQFDAGIRTDAGGCPLSDQVSTLNMAAGEFNLDGTTNIVDALLIAQCDAGINNGYCGPDDPVFCNGRAATVIGDGGTIVGTEFDDVILGTDGDELIIGKGGNDLICGGGGDDKIKGDGGNDVIFGGPGDDEIITGAGDDTSSGGEGNDYIINSQGDDDANGDAGDDRFVGGTAGSTFVGGEGFDIAEGDPAQPMCEAEVQVACGVEGTASTGELPGIGIPENPYSDGVLRAGDAPDQVGDDCVVLPPVDVIGPGYTEPFENQPARSVILRGYAWVPNGYRIASSGWASRVADNRKGFGVWPFAASSTGYPINFAPNAWEPREISFIEIEHSTGSFWPYLARNRTQSEVKGALSWGLHFEGYQIPGSTEITTDVPGPPCITRSDDWSQFRTTDFSEVAWEILSGCWAGLGDAAAGWGESIRNILPDRWDDMYRDAKKIYDNLQTAREEDRLLSALSEMAESAALDFLAVEQLQDDNGDWDITPEKVARWVGFVGCRTLAEFASGAVIGRVQSLSRALSDWNGRPDSDKGPRDNEFVYECSPSTGRCNDDNEYYDPNDIDNPDSLYGQENYEGDIRPICMNSFPPGTLVRVANGRYKPIEAVQVGDLVVARDLVSGQWNLEPVLAQWSHASEGSLTEVAFIDGSTVTSTDDHRFWLPEEQRWVFARDLVPGDYLLAPSGHVHISGLETRPGAGQTVWELTVSNSANFLVSSGTSEALVHNEACLTAGTDDHRAARWEEYLARPESERKWGPDDKDKWDNVYDANMNRASAASARMDEVATELNVDLDSGREVPVPPDQLPDFDSGRRIDIAKLDTDPPSGWEHKSGEYTYLSEEVKLELAKDAVLNGNGNWQIQWLFDGRISAPLEAALRGAGIHFEICLVPTYCPAA